MALLIINKLRMVFVPFDKAFSSPQWGFACVHEAVLRIWNGSRAIHDSSSVPITDNFIGESMSWRGPAWSVCTAQVSKFRWQSSEISHPVIPDRFEGEAPECVSLWLYPRRRSGWLTGISHSRWQNTSMAGGPCYSRTALRGTPAVQNQNSHGTTKESLLGWGGHPSTGGKTWEERTINRASSWDTIQAGGEGSVPRWMSQDSARSKEAFDCRLYG